VGGSKAFAILLSGIGSPVENQFIATGIDSMPLGTVAIASILAIASSDTSS